MKSPLETILREVEAIAAALKAQKALPTLDKNGVSAWGLSCCNRIRTAVAKGDAVGAAYIGCTLGEKLPALRELHRLAIVAARHKSPVDRVHERDTKRRAAFFAALRRGFSETNAYKKAAYELGVNPKTIRRAVHGH